jgi:hypothetical protein
MTLFNLYLNTHQSFLTDANRVAYIVDDVGKLIASSMPNSAVHFNNSTPQQISALHSPSGLIRETYQFVVDHLPSYVYKQCI